MALLTLALVAGVAGVGWWLMSGRRSIAHLISPAEAVDGVGGTSTQPTMLVLDRDYYAHVKLIELRAGKADGGSWEMRSKSPPDIAFRLYWNGTPVFTGAEREDRLIAEWDLLRLDLKDALLSGQVEVASAINAPIIRAQTGGILTVEVWDEDTAFSDEAGKFDFPVEMLREGTNAISPAESGVARLVLEMIPRDTPLPDLLERASNR